MCRNAGNGENGEFVGTREMEKTASLKKRIGKRRVETLEMEKTVSL